jgi:hypothetical protein
MRCHICDRPLNEPKFNPEVGNYDPCDTCIEVIEDTLASYTDKPAATEDDLGRDPIWDELFPKAYSPFDDE